MDLNRHQKNQQIASLERARSRGADALRPDARITKQVAAGAVQYEKVGRMETLMLDFAEGGNAGPLLRDGWSGQERERIWSVGLESTMVIAGLKPMYSYRLMLEVAGYVPPGVEMHRHLHVIVDDRNIANFVLGAHRMTISLNVPGDIIPATGSIMLRFVHPNPCRPSDYGELDTRPLDVAFFSGSLVAHDQIFEESFGDGASESNQSKHIFVEDTIVPDTQRTNQGGSKMTGQEPPKVAAVTFAYNECVNLPLWIRYYGENFGEQNLFVVDHGSTDGSTEAIGNVNRIVLPRDAFDDRRKAEFVSSFQAALLNFYDVVICGDCDEFLVADPETYVNLSHYVERMNFDYVAGIGLNVTHIVHRELPLRLERPILQQRKYALFNSATCKTLLSRVPLRWSPGLHSVNKRPRFDVSLYMFHIKSMDYNIASARHTINSANKWSDSAIAMGHGAHHRYDFEKFVKEFFLDPAGQVERDEVKSFDFASEIAQIEVSVTEREGYWSAPMNIRRLVKVPERFDLVF